MTGKGGLIAVSLLGPVCRLSVCLPRPVVPPSGKHFLWAIPFLALTALQVSPEQPQSSLAVGEQGGGGQVTGTHRHLGSGLRVPTFSAGLGGRCVQQSGVSDGLSVVSPGCGLSVSVFEGSVPGTGGGVAAHPGLVHMQGALCVHTRTQHTRELGAPPTLHLHTHT